MSTARPFAYNIGSPISGTDQVGALAVGTPTVGFTATGLEWWNGPDEDLGYVIAQSVPSDTQPTPVSGVSASVGFFRSSALTEGSFISISNAVAGPSGGGPFASGSAAKTWLNANGYWTSYPLSALVYYFGGNFTATNVFSAPKMILLNTGGTQDKSFNIGTGFNSTVRPIAIQSDEKILVGGDFTTFAGVSQNYLIRLNSDGSKDSSFNIGTGFNSGVNSIMVQSDGKILIGGNFTTFGGGSQNYLIRLNSDGSKDTSFNIGTGFDSQVVSIAVQSDGKILAGGNFSTFGGASQPRLIRLNSDGSKDTSFSIGSGFNLFVSSVAVQSDGKILAGGTFTSFLGSSQNRLIRLNSDGSKDTSLNIGTGFDNAVSSIAVQSDGKILVGGSFITFAGASQLRLIRLNSDGSKDTSLNIGTGFDGSVSRIVAQSDGKILVCGAFTTFMGASEFRLIRLNSDGSKDTSLSIGTGFNNTVQSLAVQSNGKILVGGDFQIFSGTPQNTLSKYKSDYSLDTSFAIGTGFNAQINSVAIQSDGKVLAGGTFTTFDGESQNYLIRLGTNGSKDTSFNIGTGFNNTVQSLAVQSDGKILVGGVFTTFSGGTENRLIRLNSDGSKDSSFNIGTGFGSTVFRIVAQSDGKILVGGAFTTFSGGTENRLIRLNSDGSKDSSFNIGTGFNNTVQSLAVQSDGKILVGGGFTTFAGASQLRLIRLNSDGSKDTSFSVSGVDSSVLSLAVQSDGKILAGGSFTTFLGSSQNRLIRLNSDGSKDTSLSIGTGFNSSVSSVTVQSDGKISAGGNFTAFNETLSYYNILLNSDGSVSDTTMSFNNPVSSGTIVY